MRAPKTPIVHRRRPQVLICEIGRPKPPRKVERRKQARHGMCATLQPPAQKAPERLTSLRDTLRRQVPSARVDAQSSWLKPVFGAIASLQLLALALVVLLALATGSAVLLATRSSLGTNRETIEIVHLLGGTDAQIARIFQRAIATDAASGGATGFVAATLVIILLGRRFAGLGAGLVNGGTLGWMDWALLALIPLAGIALATLTARFTVLRALARML